jgi:hypothetical protein
MRLATSAGSRESRTRNSRFHLGIGFELWTDEHTWFWLVASPGMNGGAIGAAATEAEAVHEACSSIEEISAQRRAGSAAARVPAHCSTPAVDRSNSIAMAPLDWKSSLGKLERYLTSISGAPA